MQYAFAPFAILAFWFTMAGAWVTHIVTTIQQQEWVFMVAGALLAPVAWAHGFSVWLGYNWLG